MRADPIADRAVARWGEVAAVLTPIIGPRGFAAFYVRSLCVTRAAHPSLAALPQGELEPAEISTLQATLSRHSRADAAPASGALLRTVHDLLTNLIGGELTEHLLRSGSEQPPSGLTMQDTSS